MRRKIRTISELNAEASEYHAPVPKARTLRPKPPEPSEAMSTLDDLLNHDPDVDGFSVPEVRSMDRQELKRHLRELGVKLPSSPMSRVALQVLLLRTQRQ